MTKPAQALVARYADVNHFLECYNPDRQTKIAPTLDAALDADTPSSNSSPAPTAANTSASGS